MRLLCVAALLFLSVLASAREYTFERITSHDGLSQNNVLSIYQCSDGYMWFATYDGLNRYDGYDFKVYRTSSKNKTSISSNLIHFITEDNDKNLWIGTFNDGVCRFNKNTEEFTVYRNTPETPDLITHNAVYQVRCDSKENIWLCTQGGLCHFKMLNGEVVKITKIRHSDDPESLSDNNTQDIFEDSEGRIFVSNEFSLELMRMGKNEEPRNSFYHLTDSAYYTDIRQVLEIPEGYLFSHSTGIGLIKFNAENPENSITIPLETHSSHFIQRDSKGNLWSAGDHGLYRFEYMPGNEIPYVLADHFTQGETTDRLSHPVLRCLTIDKNDILWTGTNSAGFMKCSITSARFRHYKKTIKPGSLGANKVWNIFEDSFHNLWFSTEGAGINLLPASKNKDYNTGFESYAVNPPGEQNFAFQVIDYTKNGIPYYIVGAGYMNKIVDVKLNNNEWVVKPILQEISDQVMALYKDENDVAWLGTYYGGLYRYNPKETKNSLTNFLPNNSSFPSIIVRSITEDSKERIWIGTDVGLTLLTREEKTKRNPQFVIFTHKKGDTTSISNSYTVPVIETSDGEIWIGTFGGGLNRYIEGSTETNGTFKKLDVDDGLPNNTIKQIIEDDIGNLWVTSNNGLTRIDSSRTKIRNYDVNNGLQDVEFTDLSGTKLSDGEIIIGGVNGFNAFYPNEISDDTVPPVLVFNELEVMNNIVSVNENIDGHIILTNTLHATNEITLKHFQNSFTIFFSAIQYLEPEGNQFKYILEGFEKKWVPTSHKARFARYTNIEPGTYTFKLLASNSHDVWAKEPKTIKITIKPPFWKTWWFRTVVILLVINGVVAVFYWRTRQIRKRNIILQREVDIRTKEITRKNFTLLKQSEELNESNVVLEERQQQIEEQAEELRAQKDELINQRDNLFETNALLKEANAVKDKLFSIVAHDLKNPFNSLSGFLDIITLKYDKYTDEKRKVMLGHAKSSVDTIQALLMNLLSWARSQTGAIQFKPNEANIVEVLESNIKLVRDQAKEKNIKVKLSASNPFIILSFDSDLMNTVIRNLLTNALKFTPTEGEIIVKCTDFNNQVIVAIQDSGVGISKGNLKKLFKKHEHFTTHGTNNEIGTGLGLITCKEFVEMHKGTIAVESEEGKGTTFTIVIPKS